MWILKIRLTDKEGFYEKRAKEFKLNLYCYSLSHYIKGKYAYLLAAILMEGSEKNKKDFLKSIKSDKQTVNLEIQKDFFICLTRTKRTKSLERYEHIFYEPSLIFVKPVIIFAEGGEEWEIASFNKQNLNRIINFAQKKYEGKILSFKQEKLKEIKISTMFPKLTDKQKRALELAVRYGYYEVPRKTELQRLAKIAKLSFSTFQVHLRKAEKKLIPFVIKRF